MPRVWKKFTDEEQKLKMRIFKLKKHYGITLEQYNKMFNEQKGCCLICDRHQSELKQTLGVDHCHETKIVRGLLCFDCNIGIGKFKDDINLLTKVINYLKKGIPNEMARN